jgi:hypothetical protein
MSLLRRLRAVHVLVVLVAALLAVQVVGLWSEAEYRDQETTATCTYLRFDYPENEDGSTDFDFDENVLVPFQDLSAEDRALADLYDCDMEGR